MLYHRFGFVSFATVKICQRTLHKLKMTRFVCMNIVKLIWETKAKLFCVNLTILKMIGLNILIPKSLTSRYTLHDMIENQSYLVGIGCKMRHSLLDCILHFISFLLLCIWNLQKTILKYANFVSTSTNLLAKLDASPLQNECIFLAVPQVNVDTRRGLGNCNGIWWRSYLLGNSGTEKWEHIFKTMSNYNNHGFGF